MLRKRTQTNENRQSTPNKARNEKQKRSQVAQNTIETLPQKN